MKKENYIGIALDELYRIFELLNKKYYDNELPHPMITIQAAKKPQLVGWFTLDKMWNSDAETENAKYEINIAAEGLKRDILDIVETLQHEMVHYCNKLSEIVDYHGKMHTKKFKNLAEKVGLICHKDSRLGYGLTERTPEFTEYIQKTIQPDENCFTYFRTFILKKQVAEKQKKLFKYKCPDCDTEAKAKKDVILICGNCNITLDMEEED